MSTTTCKSICQVILICTFFITGRSIAQERIETLSAESLVDEAFKIISGTPSQERDWQRFKLLFKPTAQFIASPVNKETGTNNLLVRSIDEMIEGQSAWLKENSLFEYCILKKTEQFRHLAHILCTYESRKNDTELYGRGISSFQLMHDGKRWWIINWFWLGDSYWLS